MASRWRSFSSCSAVTKLFEQAQAGGLFTEDSVIRGKVLNVKFAGPDEFEKKGVVIANGDVADFDKLVRHWSRKIGGDCWMERWMEWAYWKSERDLYKRYCLWYVGQDDSGGHRRQW